MEYLMQYQAVALFLGAFFFGETVIISSAFLSGQGFISPITLLSMAFLGTVVSDMIWFIVGRKILTLLHRWEKYKIQSEKVFPHLEKVFHHKLFLILLFIKFLYGTRILTILYLSMHRMKTGTFILYNSLGTLLWLAVILPIGWLAGKSIINILPFLNKIHYVVLSLVVLVVVFRYVSQWLSNKITKE
jgi:membrane protein DedA with SNARE-associated domain